MTEDDDIPTLSQKTLQALQEFLQEQAGEKENNTVSEDWNLSQFWYDEDTTSTLSLAAFSLCNDTSNIALISCPTIYPHIQNLITSNNKNVNVTLFEYDKRFAKYDPDFVYYDYNFPVSFKPELGKSFDVILVDPPFLSKECLTKVSETIYFLKKVDSKIILCTGSVMETLAGKLLQVYKCSFQPKHQRNLANEFICLTNFGEIS